MATVQSETMDQTKDILPPALAGGSTGARQAVSGSVAAEGDASAQAIIDAVLAGATLREVHGISEDLMEGVYAHAYRFYQQGKLKEAEAFFRFLCVYDFYNPDYPMGLAAVFQLRKQYKEAIDLYALAFALGKKDYRPMFYAGQCNLLLRKLGPAKKCFEVVAEHAPDAALREQASACIGAIKDARQRVKGQAGQQPKTES